MYEHHAEDIIKALEIEIRVCHSLDGLEELEMKQFVLKRIYKLIKAT